MRGASHIFFHPPTLCQTSPTQRGGTHSPLRISSVSRSQNLYAGTSSYLFQRHCCGCITESRGRKVYRAISRSMMMTGIRFSSGTFLLGRSGSRNQEQERRTGSVNLVASNGPKSQAWSVGQRLLQVEWTVHHGRSSFIGLLYVSVPFLNAH